MKTRYGSVVIAALCLTAGAAAHAETSQVMAQQEFETKGEIDAVTVYRGQALVTRHVDVPGPAGLREMIVTDLPEHIVPESLHAESHGGSEVRSVRYRERPVTRDIRAEVEALESKIQERRDQLQIVERRLEAQAEHRRYLNKLEEFTAPTATAELSRGVLDADTLKELSTFLHEQRNSLAEAELELTFSKRDLTREIELLQRQRNQLGSAGTRTAREAVMLINVTDGEGADVRLHYLVDRATWEPSYTIRGDIDEHRMTVEYTASIRQLSGEDWDDVAMTLSTATPSLVARAPRLTSLAIGLTSGDQRRSHGPDARQLRAQQLEFERMRSRNLPPQRDGQAAERAADFDAKMNVIAGEIQVGEYLGASAAPQDDPAENEGLSVSYHLASRTSLPSRADRQLIQIAAMPMDGDFYRVAVPVLTSYVYDEAVTTNRTNRVLLAGPISTYANGSFVGHSALPDVTVGEEVTIGFGINSSLRSHRRLVKQDETVRGGNRIVDLTYRLSVENFNESATTVRLLDRLPQSDSDAIRLTIIDDGDSSEAGVRHHEINHEDGIIRWDLDVPGRSVADSAAEIEYTIRLEHDRQMTIVGMDS